MTAPGRIPSGSPPPVPRLRHNNPFRAVLDEMKPLGLSLSAGVVSAVNANSIDFDVDGVTIPDVKVIGDLPAVSDQLWALKHGSTLLAINPGVTGDFLPLSGGTLSGELIIDRADNGAVATFKRSGTEVGSITVTASATTYNTSSDACLKDNVRESDESALDRVLALPIRKWEWKEGGATDEGYVAQEVEQVAPAVVSTIARGDGSQVKMLDYGRMSYLHGGAIRELAARLETVEATLEALK